MSIQLLHQYINLRSNLFSYKSDFPIDPSVVYSSLGSNSVYIRSTYEVNAYHVLVDFCVPEDEFDTDFVEDLLWMDQHPSLLVIRAEQIIDDQMIREYAMFLEDGFLPATSHMESWRFVFNMYHLAPMESIYYTPQQ